MMAFAREYKADPKFSEKRCRNLVRKIDTDKSGTVSEEEFVVFFAALTRGVDDTTFDEGIQKYMETAKNLQKKYRESFQHDS